MTERSERIVDEARAWIGTPYHHQASLRGVWRAVVGREPERLPPYSPDWGAVAGEEALTAVGRAHFADVPVGARAPGDVLLFRMRAGRIAKHCGVLTTPERFVHAQEGVCVSEVALTDWWAKRIVAVFRFPEGPRTGRD